MHGDDDDVTVRDDGGGSDQPLPQRTQDASSAALASYSVSPLAGEAILRPQ